MSSFSSGRSAVFKIVEKKKNVFFAQKLCPCRTRVVEFRQFKSESMQKSTKIAFSWQGSKNQNRSSFADWYTLVSLQTLCSFFFERSIRFREKRRKPYQAPQAISQAKNRVEIIMIRWTRVPIQSR